MDQVSRPLQIVLLAAIAFAAVWFVALRPKPDKGSSAPAPAPPAQAPPKKSAIPGGLGSALDKARAAKAQGDAAATGRSDRVDAAADGQNAPSTPVQARPGARAMGVRLAGEHAQARQGGPGFGTPGKVRKALAKGHAVVLLFYSRRSSDDVAVRSEVAAVSRRGGRVDAWAVSIHGLARFKNALQGVQVLQSPTVVVLSRKREPAVFPGYTDRAQIDQAAAVALGR